MGKRGPKPWVPTDEEIAKIKLYAGLGATQDQVAAMLGKCKDTLTRNERANEALKVGLAETVAKVAGTLVRKALSGDTASAIFYLKTQGRWKETHQIEHSGKDGGPIEVKKAVDASDDELAAVALGKRA